MPKYPKRRPNVPFDGKTCVRYDCGYIYNKVAFTVLGDRDLWIRVCSGHAPKKTAFDFFVDNFKSYTAVEVIYNISQFNAMPGTRTDDDWGRHFENGVLEIWHALNLDFGWTRPLKKFNEARQ